MTNNRRDCIKFADELLSDLFDGEKNATVRYNGFESVKVGDTLVAITEAESPVAKNDITRTATVNAIEARSILDVFGADYSSETPQDVIDSLNKYYDDTIGPRTTVRVLVFEVDPNV